MEVKKGFLAKKALPQDITGAYSVDFDLQNGALQEGSNIRALAYSHCGCDLDKSYLRCLTLRILLSDSVLWLSET